MIAYSAVAYVQQEVSFALGFLIPLISMILALIIFVAVRGRYIHLPPSGK
jgi:peptide/histidine transporter 3/4